MSIGEFKPGSDRVESENRYGDREVGLNHPDVPGFVRIRDNGDIEIVGGEGLAFIMSPSTGSITLVADKIKFLTKESGLRWNKKTFNGKATKYNEPTFTVVDDVASAGLYRDVNYFLDDDMPLFDGATLPDSLLSIEAEEEEEETVNVEIAEDETNM